MIRTAVSLSAALVLAASTGDPAAASRRDMLTEPGPSARDVARSEQAVRERAAEVGRVKSRLAQESGELQGLATAAEVAVERYNGELVRLRQAHETFENTRQRLARAEESYRRTREEAAEFAAAAYRAGTGIAPWVAALTGPGGPQDSMDRAGLVEVLAHRQAGMVQRVQAARVICDMFRRQAQTALRDRQAAAGRAEAAKRAAAELVTAQRSQIQRINARKTALVARLGRARARAEQLQAAREQARDQARGRAAVAAVPGASGRGALVVRAALRWLGTPYSWGGGTVSGPSLGIAHGAGIRGFDCSGLALHAWNRAGVRLDHWTGTQWTSGPHIPTGRLRPGDLVFFGSDPAQPSTIHHVGIYIGRGQMVEAPYTGARVRVSSIWRPDLVGATRPAG
jgi:cell wall-associated NlpC family hydrolase